VVSDYVGRCLIKLSYPFNAKDRSSGIGCVSLHYGFFYGRAPSNSAYLRLPAELVGYDILNIASSALHAFG